MIKIVVALELNFGRGYNHNLTYLFLLSVVHQYSNGLLCIYFHFKKEEKGDR